MENISKRKEVNGKLKSKRTIEFEKFILGKKYYNKLNEEIIVIGCENSRNVKIYFPLYDYTRYVSYNNLNKFNITCPYSRVYCNSGFLGEGEFSISEGVKFTKAGGVWVDMIRRCCDEKYRSKKPFYKDSRICDEWLNFQNFAKWYYDNYYEIDGEQMCLDKDILHKHNKLYSPDNCMIVPQTINKLLERNSSSNGLPLGVHYDKRKFKYIAQCKGNRANNGYLGSFNTKEEAFQAYKEAKEHRIKLIADKYKDKIPQRLYGALYSYKVDITD